jgi:hypothetical protein
MPCAYEIDADYRLIRTRIWGLLTYAELTANRLRMENDPAFKADFSQLADLREVTAIALTGDQIREFAAHSPFTPGTRRAVVASSDVAFGLGRVYGSYREAISPKDQIRIFRHLNDAEEWLGLPMPRAHSAKR